MVAKRHTGSLLMIDPFGPQLPNHDLQQHTPVNRRIYSRGYLSMQLRVEQIAYALTFRQSLAHTARTARWCRSHQQAEIRPPALALSPPAAAQIDKSAHQRADVVLTLVREL